MLSPASINGYDIFVIQIFFYSFAILKIKDTSLWRHFYQSLLEKIVEATIVFVLKQRNK